MRRPPPIYAAFCIVVLALFTFTKVQGLAPWGSNSGLRGTTGSGGSGGYGGYGGSYGSGSYGGVSGGSHK